MNSVYISVGATLILVLLAALVGPFFVDWSTYRSTFEEYGEEILGHRVSVMGEADMRLLPTPTLVFTDVRVGEAEDPLLAVSRFAVRVELPPLLRGEIRVMDMRLEKPRLQLSLDERGRLDWFTRARSGAAISSLDPDDVVIDQVEIVDGSIRVVDARSGGTHTASGANFIMSARSLAGPFKLDGSLRVEDAPVNLRFASGRLENGALRVKAQVVPATYPAEFFFDGDLIQSNGQPSYEGEFTVSSVTPEDLLHQSWRSEGRFHLDPAALKLEEANFLYGPQERPLTFEGEGEVDFASPAQFELRVSAKQIDLDRLLGAGPKNPASAKAAASKLLALAASLPPPPLPGRIDFQAPSVVVAGGVIQNVKLDAQSHANGWGVHRAAGKLPGRTNISLTGDLEVFPRPAYRGRVALDSEQPAGLLDWLSGGVEGIPPMEPVAFEGRLAADGDGFALNELSFRLADAPGRGTIDYRTPENQSAAFSVDVDAERLDLDQIRIFANLIGLTSKTGGERLEVPRTEMSLKLFARTLIAGAVKARDVAVDANYLGDKLSITEFTARDIAGANVSVRGVVENASSAPDGDLEADIDAPRASGLLAVASSLFPDTPVLKQLNARADLLEPASLSLRFNGRSAPEGGSSAAKVDIEGDIAGTRLVGFSELDGRLDQWRDARLLLELELERDNGGELLRQFGVDSVPLAGVGAGSFKLKAQGTANDELDFRARANVAGGTALFVGQAQAPQDMPISYTGDLVAQAKDITTLMLLAGRMPPLMAGAQDVDLAAHIEGVGDAFRISDIAGRLASSQIAGNLSVELRKRLKTVPARVSGELSLSRLDLQSVAMLMLGADSWRPMVGEPEEGLWSSRAFGAPIATGLDADIDIVSDHFSFGEGIVASSAKSRVRLRDNELGLTVESAELGGGALQGFMEIRRAGGQAELSGNLNLDGADVASFAPRKSGRVIATGTFDLAAEFAGAGRSVSGVVSSLSGGGAIDVRAGQIRGVNPDAFELVMRAADSGLELSDEAIRKAFASHLDAGVIDFQRADGTFSIAGGVVRMSGVNVEARSAALLASARIKLSDLTLDAEMDVKVQPNEEAVTGAEPQITLLFQGAVSSPERTIDISPFTAFLTLRAFEKEVSRVEKMQSEIIERDRFMRELKRQRQERERKARAEDAARREKIEKNQDGGENGQGKTSPAAAPVVTPAPSAPIPAPSAPAPAPAPAPAAPAAQNFTDRIQAVIDAASAPSYDDESALAPLDEPVIIDDLPVMGVEDANAPAGEGGDLLAPMSAMEVLRERRRLRENRRDGTFGGGQPRFRTLPNGIIVEQ